MIRKFWMIWMAVCLAALLAACGSGEQATPTMDPAAVYTAAAKTANVRLTQMLAQTPSPVPQTPTPTQDVAMTAAVQTVSAQLTQTAAVAVTPTPATSPTATQAAASGLADRALFVSDVTVPDGSDYKPKDAFTKTWRIRNIGASTWNTDYYVVFVGGEKMGGPDTQRLTASVPPGGEIDISVNMVAPETPGRYTGYWKLLNASGKFFDDTFYVMIDVLAGTQVAASPTVTFTPGPSVTPGGPTATASPTTASSITNMNMTVDNASVTGACPQPFNFTATFDLATNALVTYQLEAGSSTPGVTFSLPAAQSVQMNPGKQTLNFSLTFTNTMTGWVRLRITSPLDITSNQADFSLTCQP